MEWNDTLKGLITALGLGLLTGVVRERRHEPGITKAGTRTHALVAVLGAILLQTKQPLHRLSRELMSEQGLQDALMLAAAALVVMPLLPQTAVDPWGCWSRRRSGASWCW